MPTILQLVAFNTKVGPTTVGIRAINNGNPRLYEMDRYKFMNLFPNQQLSSNLRELTRSLPLVGIGFLEGLTIKEFNVCENMEEAEDDLNKMEAVPVFSDDDDNTFTNQAANSTVTDQAENSTNTDQAASAKKKLNYSSAPSSSSKTTSQSSAEVPSMHDYLPYREDGSFLCYDSRSSTPPQRRVQHIKHKDIFSLNVHSDDDNTTDPKPSVSTGNPNDSKPLNQPGNESDCKEEETDKSNGDEPSD